MKYIFTDGELVILRLLVEQEIENGTTINTMKSLIWLYDKITSILKEKENSVNEQLHLYVTTLKQYFL